MRTMPSLHSAIAMLAALVAETGLIAQIPPAPVGPKYEKIPQSQPFKQLDPSKRQPESTPQQPGKPGGGSGGGGGGGGAGSGTAPPQPGQPAQTPAPEKPSPAPPKEPPEQAPPPPRPAVDWSPFSIPIVSGATRRCNATILRDPDGPHLVTHVSALGLGTGASSVDIEFFRPIEGAKPPASARVAMIEAMPIARFRWLPELPEYVVLDLRPEDAVLQDAKALQFGPGDWYRGPLPAVVGRRLESIWRDNRSSSPTGPIVEPSTRAVGIRSSPLGGIPRIDIDPATAADACAAPFRITEAQGLLGIGGEPNRRRATSGPEDEVNDVITREELEQLIRRARPFDHGAYLEHLLKSWGNPEGYRELVAFLRKNGFGAVANWRLGALKADGYADAYDPAKSPDGTSRAIAVLSEDRQDDLDLELRKDQLQGLGKDLAPYRDAVVRVDDPAAVRDAERLVRARRAAGSSRTSPSDARLLIIEAAPTSSAAPRLPDIR